MSDFCPCGVTLMGYPGENDGLCSTCSAQPHPGRDNDGIPSCNCDECEAYWDRICTESAAAAERFNRQLVCTCGWTGAYAEQHETSAGCRITYRASETERGPTSAEEASRVG